MSVVINGTNLKSTTFNGQNVETIYYNGSLVWERPPEIQLISGIQSDGKAWIKTDFSPSDFLYHHSNLYFRDNTYGTLHDYSIEVEFSILEIPTTTAYQYLVGNSEETVDSYTSYIKYQFYNNDGDKISFYPSNGYKKYLITPGFTFNIGQKNKIKAITQDNWQIHVYFYQEEDGVYVQKYDKWGGDSTGGSGYSTKPYTILRYVSNSGDIHTPKNQTGIVIHSITFGDENAKKKELQRILQPAIMRNKGVETVGLYDAKRDIFYGPQKGSFIPHY